MGLEGGVSTGPCRDGSIPRPAHHHRERDGSGAVLFFKRYFHRTANLAGCIELCQGQTYFRLCFVFFIYK